MRSERSVYLGRWILYLVTPAQLLTFFDVHSPTSAAKQTVTQEQTRVFRRSNAFGTRTGTELTSALMRSHIRPY